MKVTPKTKRAVKHATATTAVHTGLSFCEETGAVMPPIFATSTFARGNRYDFDYTRSGNPNFVNLAETLASLEHARFATVFGSGVAAMTAVVSGLKSGDLIVAEENLYGSTYRLFEQVFRKWGLRVAYSDLTQPDAIKQIAAQRPTLVWLESPTNPMLKVLDLKAIARVARAVGSTVLIDNTFASGGLQRPLELGIDLSLSSSTKYWNGHSDSLGGVVCTNDPAWQKRMVFAQKALGLQPSPFDAWLISRGVRTIELRMNQHSQSALIIARALERLSCVKTVRYPFLPSHPQYALAKRQMRAGSGMITVDFAFSAAETQRFLKRLKLFTVAVSLGGVESLVAHPATMTHPTVPAAERKRLGITASLVRLSVGIEDVNDLLADLGQALQAVRPRDRSVKQLVAKRAAPITNPKLGNRKQGIRNR